MANDDSGRVALVLPIVALLAVPTLTVVLSHVAWRARPVSRWRCGIVDKTVPDDSRREHAGLAWVLDHARVPSPRGTTSAWDARRDYLGFHPERAAGDRLTPEWLRGRDLVYVVDTYGVHSDDLAPAPAPSPGRRSDVVYGGLDLDEVAALEGHVAAGGALIAEFNTLASPTASAPRARLEALLGVRPSGWTGRWFVDLSDAREVPPWVRSFFRIHHGSTDALRGPGFLLVNEDTRVEVLRDGVEVEDAGLHVVQRSPRDPLLAGVEDALPYRYWFEIVAPAARTEVLAGYELRVTRAGAEVLARAGVPARFPAVLRAARAPLRLYFAGDFADNRMRTGPSRLAGWPALMAWLAGDVRETGPAPFFWRFYVPLMRNVLAMSR